MPGDGFCVCAAAGVAATLRIRRSPFMLLDRAEAILCTLWAERVFPVAIRGSSVTLWRPHRKQIVEKTLIRICFTSLVFLTACVQPSEVARFAKSASEATAEFPPVAKEMYASCLRFEAYKAQRISGWYDNEYLRMQCASRDSAVAGVLAANNV